MKAQGVAPRGPSRVSSVTSEPEKAASEYTESEFSEHEDAPPQTQSCGSFTKSATPISSTDDSEASPAIASTAPPPPALADPRPRRGSLCAMPSSCSDKCCKNPQAPEASAKRLVWSDSDADDEDEDVGILHGWPVPVRKAPKSKQLNKVNQRVTA